jgi:serine/threonine-protein kinase RsbW
MKRDEDLNRGLLLKLELTSNPSVLCAVRGAAERLTESLGFSASDCRAVTRALDEALTNIIRHTYSSRPDQPIQVLFRSVERQPDPESAPGMEILLYDSGPAIDPEKMCPRALEEVKPGGLGLHFIQQSMDIVEYNRTNGTNCLRLVKYVRTPQPDVKS